MARLDDLVNRFANTPVYEHERLSLDITEAIAQRMDELGLTRAALAERLGVSRARVTQILAGTDNLTLKTLVAVSIALDCKVELRLKSRNSEGRLTDRWIDVIHEPVPNEDDHPRSPHEFAA